MGSKKKRKSGGKDAQNEEPPRKKAAGEQGGRQGPSPLTWKGDGVQATLAGGQGLLFLGRGWLTVSSGAVLAQGKLCQAGDAPAELCADERSGGALLLEAVVSNLQLQVPRASEGVEVSLAITSSPPQQPAGAVTDAASAGRPPAGRPSFSLHLADDTAAPRHLPFPAAWQQAAAEVAGSVAGGPPGVPAVIAVCGSKNAGKSTFARHLVNCLLNTHPVVAFLDTDCGQSEFTPPGLVSLTLLTRPVFGPPHMHHRQPVLSYFLGDLSPASDPLLYLRLVRELFCCYCQHGAAAAAAAAAAADPAGGGGGSSSSAHPSATLPPLVVNTHGWVKGLGLDVLGELLASLQPLTHLVQLCSPNPHKNLPEGVFWAAAGDPSQPPPAPLTWQLPALGGGVEAQPTLSGVSQSSARTTATATTGGGAGGEDGGGRGRGLSAVESRALQWGAFAQQCIAAMHTSEPDGSSHSSGSGPAAQQQQQAATAAVGAAGAPELADGLAALVPYELSMDDVDIQVLHSSMPPSQLLYALNASLVGLCAAPRHDSPEPDPPAPCLGLGLVRAVDAGRRTLYVLSPLGEEALERVTTLQLGKLELPSSLLQSGAYLSPYLCLFSLTSMGTGAGVIKSRNNLLRQSQL